MILRMRYACSGACVRGCEVECHSKMNAGSGLVALNNLLRIEHSTGSSEADSTPAHPATRTVVHSSATSSTTFHATQRVGINLA